MNKDQVKNVSTLISFMEGLSDPKFTMRKFGDSLCRTPSCALGWAATIPEFKQRGLDLSELIDVSDFQYAPRIAKTIFGDFAELFSSILGDKIKTPQQWASHAREWLRSQGHEVSQPDDGFKSFMSKVLSSEPVKVRA